MSCALGFDYGSRLIGVAVGNRLTASARGIAAIPNRQSVPDWTQLDSLRKDWLPDTLVVGLPLTLEGEEQPASRAARRFAEQLGERYGLPVVLVDERHTSREAAQRFAQARAAGLKRKSDALKIDAEAAAVILERWLSGVSQPLPGMAS
ncbi:MAG TPA: Holliday junction resolvase RuvX [Dyella sp.]|uniref:Holliday junction resolvase RuvX n=1 Tax=Dyella sp. TaxID=1869338 RepID=UPI002F951D16